MIFPTKVEGTFMAVKGSLGPGLRRGAFFFWTKSETSPQEESTLSVQVDSCCRVNPRPLLENCRPRDEDPLLYPLDEDVCLEEPAYPVCPDAESTGVSQSSSLIYRIREQNTCFMGALSTWFNKWINVFVCVFTVADSLVNRAEKMRKQWISCTNTFYYVVEHNFVIRHKNGEHDAAAAKTGTNAPMKTTKLSGSGQHVRHATRRATREAFVFLFFISRTNWK